MAGDIKFWSLQFVFFHFLNLGSVCSTTSSACGICIKTYYCCISKKLFQLDKTSRMNVSCHTSGTSACFPNRRIRPRWQTMAAFRGVAAYIWRPKFHIFAGIVFATWHLLATTFTNASAITRRTRATIRQSEYCIAIETYMFDPVVDLQG
jgi:hypothetical protein